jgi:hypothetical protein
VPAGARFERVRDRTLQRDAVSDARSLASLIVRLQPRRAAEHPLDGRDGRLERIELLGAIRLGVAETA